MAFLDFQRLKQNIDLCFEYSRDNLTFNEEQRDKWLIKGYEQKERLKKIAGENLSPDSNSKVLEANAKITEINEILKSKQESLNSFANNLQKISDAVGILDKIIGFVI